MWLLPVLLILVAFLALVSSLYALAVTRVPVMRTPRTHLEDIVHQADLVPGQVVVDAGCGDGRTLVALCASEGVRGRGYELNGPVWLAGAMRVLFRRGVAGRVRVYWRDFFRCELEDVDVVYCYLMPASMVRVAEKCAEEMRAGSVLLSYLWEVPGWIPERTVQLGQRADPLFVYRIPGRNGAPADARQLDPETGQKLDGPTT